MSPQEGKKGEALPREKAARLARKLRALSRSPNSHEADRARERFRYITSAYGLREEDLLDGEEEESGARASVRVGGPSGGREDAWRETVAFGVARRWRCKALRGRGQIAFSGVSAARASVEYSFLVREIEEVQERIWRSYDHKYRLTIQAEHRRVFFRAMAEATAEAVTIGERSHSPQVSFADEGRREGIAVMRRLRELDSAG